MSLLARALGQGSTYRVSSNSPRILSDATAGLTPKHLVLIHDLSDYEGEICGPGIAKLSLYKLTNVTVTISTRIISSLIEISHCSNIRLCFVDDQEGTEKYPSIIQIDPQIDGLQIHFTPVDSTRWPATALVVAPQLEPSAKGLGLKNIVAAVKGTSTRLIDDNGVIHDDLLRSIGGKPQAEQFKIELVDDENSSTKKWSMSTLEKEKGYPIMQK